MLLPCITVLLLFRHDPVTPACNRIKCNVLPVPCLVLAAGPEATGPLSPHSPGQPHLAKSGLGAPAVSAGPAPAPSLGAEICAAGPVAISGAIQPHGALLAVTADGWCITHASENLADFLGVDARAALGRPVQNLIGEEACRALLDARPAGRTDLGEIVVDGQRLQLQAYWSGCGQSPSPHDRICIDIEPINDALRLMPTATGVQSLLETFRNATTALELGELAIAGLSTISGYDRVMLYRFDDQGHGEVVAERHASLLEPCLGNHYPSTDIPPRARAQYLLQRVGAVADSSYQPVRLLTYAALDDQSPLDLTFSGLRSVSPVHREFMRNMGTAASLSVGLACGDTLWGLLLCQNSVPRIASPQLRAVADIVGQVVSLLLPGLEEAEVHAQQQERAATLAILVDRLTALLPLPEALAASEKEILHLVNATGVAVRMDRSLFCLGRTPEPEIVERMLVELQSGGGGIVAIDDLGQRHPAFAGSASIASGVLLLPLAQGFASLILWFRPELPRTVTWAGDPASHGAVDPLTGKTSPRKSFAAWTQTVRGRSAEWTGADVALAAQLRDAVAGEVAHRAKAELAWLRHYQALSDGLELKVEQRTRALESEIAERMKAEATLQQAQKMEAIGQLTGGVAHDFNNILAAILSNLDLAQSRAPGPLVERFLRNAQHAAERGAKLTDHLLSFARKQPLRREACNLNTLSLGFETLIKRALGPAVTLRMMLDDDIWTVVADATQFEMALLNLAVNARDAMPDGGSFTLSSENIQAGSAGIPGDLAPGDYVRVTAQDSGSGMTRAVVNRAFEPFYSTKEIGQGTGLGLSQVYGFCKQLGGSAMLSSTPGVGTRVGLWFPREHTLRPEVSASVAPPAPHLRWNGRRLLVIDDDPDVLEATCETLQAMGFEVVPAPSASAGLQILAADTSIDLAVTDFSMPGMNGIEFIRLARLSRPKLPCLLVTGYADISSLTDTLTRDIMILRKPYRMKELAASIESLGTAEMPPNARLN